MVILLSTILLFLFTLPVFPGWVDTTLVADGTPGPYSLGTRYIHSNSIQVVFSSDGLDSLSLGKSDSTNSDSTIPIPIPPFTYVPDANGILFSEPIEEGIPMRIRFQTAYMGLQKSFRLYDEMYLDTADLDTDSSFPNAPSVFDRMMNDEAVTVSGFKSVGVTVGSRGEMNLEQALEVRIFGTVAPQTELSANLSDQGTSLEGATREIGELDMVYLTLTNPSFEATVGDQYVSLPPGGLLHEQKKIKGISAQYKGRQLSAKLSGAISGGKFAVQTMRGRLGFQGPYYLTGNGEADYITPIGGTVRVTIDGKTLEEGPENDYVVDYDLGAIRFTSKFPIDDDQSIRVEYEYKSFDYQRLYSGLDLGYSNPDSLVVVTAAIRHETDNKQNPIEFQLDQIVLDSLRNAGDSLPLVPTGRKVLPEDVPAESKVNPLYGVTTDEATDEPFYVYKPFDPDNPANRSDYYHVWFRHVGLGNGAYTIDQPLTDSLDYIEPVYQYVGPGAGAYSAKSPAPAPGKTTIGQISARVEPREWFSLATDLAGEDRDRNLFSEKDDHDNSSGAARSRFRLGRKDETQHSAWVGATHAYVDKRFGKEVVSIFERRYDWDREHETGAPADLNLWDVQLGTIIRPGWSADAGYGQYIRGDKVLTHRYRGHARARPLSSLSLSYSRDMFFHLDSLHAGSMQQDELSATFDRDNYRIGLTVDDQWRTHADTPGGGSYGARLFTRIEPISLEETLYYSRHVRGNMLVTAPDTGSYLRWDQQASWEMLPGWKLEGRSSYQQRIREVQRLHEDTLRTDSDSTRSILVDINNDLSFPDKGFGLRLDYSVTSEIASKYVQTPVYAGAGQGDYSWDPVKEEFVSAGGDLKESDYYVTSVELFDTTNPNQVRKTSLRGSWSYTPNQDDGSGILADLSWRGIGLIDEHLVGDHLDLGSWVPGSYSVQSAYDSAFFFPDSQITYATLEYRQELLWRPSPLPGLSMTMFAAPTYRKNYGSRDRTLEVGTEIKKGWDKFSLGIDGRILRIKRDEIRSPRKDTVIDANVTLRQQYSPLSILSFSLAESGGMASRLSNEPSFRLSADGPNYYSIRPSCTVTPGKAGFIELGYTFSQVAIPGYLDSRMAEGFGGGTTHLVQMLANLQTGDNFIVSGNWRTEFTRDYNEKEFGKGFHVVSLEMKVFL